MSPYRDPPKPLEDAPVLCPKCSQPVMQAWQLRDGSREVTKVLCRNCGWRLK